MTPAGTCPRDRSHPSLSKPVPGTGRDRVTISVAKRCNTNRYAYQTCPRNSLGTGLLAPVPKLSPPNRGTGGGTDPLPPLGDDPLRPHRP